MPLRKSCLPITCASVVLGNALYSLIILRAKVLVRSCKLFSMYPELEVGLFRVPGGKGERLRAAKRRKAKGERRK